MPTDRASAHPAPDMHLQPTTKVGWPRALQINRLMMEAKG